MGEVHTFPEVWVTGKLRQLTGLVSCLFAMLPEYELPEKAAMRRALQQPQMVRVLRLQRTHQHIERRQLPQIPDPGVL
jgi:hypothetical protein